MEYEYTKIEKILEINNDMTHNFYYLYHGKIYTNDRKKFKRFKYVQMFDIFDIQEYFDKDILTQKDIKEYARDYGYNGIIENYVNNIKDEYDTDNIKKLITYCNKTINDYNRC
nr:MAG TPA: hypothetical protein [Caudoviricetes sp.]